jgi:hypothetical protein
LIGLFLVGRDLVEQGFQGSRLFAGVDQVHEQTIEIIRIPGKGLGEIGATLHLGLDAQDHILHGGLFMAAAHDLERLHQRHAGRHHHRHLAREHRDVLRDDFLAAAAEQGLGLLPDHLGIDALLAQGRLDELGVKAFHFPLYPRSLAVHALVQEVDFLALGLGCHDRSSVCWVHHYRATSFKPQATGMPLAACSMKFL